MNIKIITTSTSCIGYLRHNKEIEVIPELIRYSKNEEYSDFIDVSSENFYNRLTYDKYASPRVFPQHMLYIKNLALKAINDGYDSILFILPLAEIMDYKSNIETAVSRLNIKFEIAEANTLGYPLGYLTMEAYRLANEGHTLEECKQMILSMSKNIGMLLYSYNKEPEITLEADLKSLTNEVNDKFGRLYSLADGRLTPIKPLKSKPIVYQMLEMFHNAVKNKESIPFLSYTRATAYKRVLEDNLRYLYDDNNLRLRGIPLPSALGTRLGNNIIAIGYIIKEDHHENN